MGVCCTGFVGLTFVWEIHGAIEFFLLGVIHSNVFLTRQILIYDSPKNHFGD
jgi:hypothetical protein